MKILNFDQFMALKGEVLFQKYQPAIRDEFEIKVGNCGDNDFVTGTLNWLDGEGDSDLFDKLCEAQDNSEVDIPLDLYCYGRDCCYNKEQLFAVYSKKDVQDLIDRLIQVRDRMQ